MKTFLFIFVLIGVSAWNGSAGQSPAAERPGVPGTPPPATVAPGEPKKPVRAGAAVYASAARTGSSDAIPPLVIQFSSTNQGVIQKWEEDLSVMTHIIEQALQRAADDDGPSVTKMGIPLLMTASRSVRPLYLEGFGALFMIKVNFPVLPPSRTEEEKPERADSEWDRAHEELYGRQEPWLGPATAEPGADYQPEQVEALKEELIESLKNAANIRNLKPDEYVSITVFGAPTGGAKVVKKSRKPKNDAGDAAAKEIERVIRDQINPSRSTRPGTVFTMRVKKSDIDAFYNSKIDLEGFQKKIAMNSYLGNGYGITSLNSWIRTAIQEPLFKALR